MNAEIGGSSWMFLNIKKVIFMILIISMQRFQNNTHNRILYNKNVKENKIMLNAVTGKISY